MAHLHSAMFTGQAYVEMFINVGNQLSKGLGYVKKYSINFLTSFQECIAEQACVGCLENTGSTIGNPHHIILL